MHDEQRWALTGYRRRKDVGEGFGFSARSEERRVGKERLPTESFICKMQMKAGQRKRAGKAMEGWWLRHPRKSTTQKAV